jgi:hypothetical protein
MKKLQPSGRERSLELFAAHGNEKAPLDTARADVGALSWLERGGERKLQPIPPQPSGGAFRLTDDA